MRVTVVGAGVMGLATAWSLARAGHEVSVYEQGPVPNPAGTSVDEQRLIRHPYGDRLGYVQMVSEAYAVWDEVWADLGETLYAPTGTLVVDTSPDGWARVSAATLERHGLSVEWLAPAELARRFPLLSGDGGAASFYLQSGGVLLAGRIVESLARRLMQRGVTIRPLTRVAEVDPERALVVLEGGARVEADVLVIAAGAWVTRLLPALVPRLRPSRQVVVYFELPAAAAAVWAAHPLVLDIGRDAGLYLVPPVLGTRLKIGDHRFSLGGDPDGDRVPRADEVEAVVALARRRVVGFDSYRVAESRACFYTVAADERFVVEPLGRSWLMSPCSGHGFKFAPVLGRRVAEAITGARDPAAVSRWAAGAFDAGAPGR